MRFKKIFAATTPLFILLLQFSCEQSQAVDAPNATVKEQTDAETTVPPLLAKALSTHGGLENWQKMNTLQYTLIIDGQPEKTSVDLNSRQTLLAHPDYQIGFDGKDVWVAPNKMAYREGKRSARFYHNLNFYFFAIPFVLADPGINYEVLDTASIAGETYDLLKISYDPGTGDAPDDYYICYFDRETHQLEWLRYTVTYYSGKPSDRYNMLKYDTWQLVSGLLVPEKLIGYTYENGSIGDPRYEKVFQDVSFTTTSLNPNIFLRPAASEIDSLIVN